MMLSPFLLENKNEYIAWRKQKLKKALTFDKPNDSFFICIKNASQLTQQERNTILERCHQNSICLYRIDTNTGTKNNIHQLAQQISLNNLDSNICADKDSLTSITHTEHEGQHEYIPYSTKQLSWHTDGYYNKANKQINTMLLHCVRPAKTGGVSFLMDHEIAYIMLRDKSPSYIEGLMQSDTMTIPANNQDGVVIREAQTGPVFSINKAGQLHMRYSARKRNIEWKQTAPILEALDYLENLLNSDSPYITEYKLKAGEGLICRNVLHRRTSFKDHDKAAKKRLLYRGRYYDHLPQPT